MKLVTVFSLGLLLAGAGIAGAQDVRYNFDKSANFAQFKTYKWVSIKNAAKVSDLVDKQIRDSIDAQLATKGLQKTDAENADLLVAYQAAVGQEKEMTTYDTGWGYGPGYGRGWYGAGGGGMSTSQTNTIYVGMIVLDMYNNPAKTLVWRGSASKTLDMKAKPDKQQKNLDKAMAKLLKNYPPQEKK